MLTLGVGRGVADFCCFLQRHCLLFIPLSLSGGLTCVGCTCGPPGSQVSFQDQPIPSSSRRLKGREEEGEGCVF